MKNITSTLLVIGASESSLLHLKEKVCSLVVILHGNSL